MESASVPEQADFSTDVRDNGRVAVAVHPLSPAAAPLARCLLDYLRKLPPFQAADQREGVLSLKFLYSLPHWVTSEIKKDMFSASRRRRLACLLCVDYCKDEDEVTNTYTGFKDACTLVGNTLLTSRCLVYGPSEANCVEDKRGVSFFNLSCSPTSIAEGEGDLQYKRIDGVLSDCMAIVYSKMSGVLKEADMIKLSISSSSSLQEGRDGGGGITGSGQQGDDVEQTRHRLAQGRKLLADVHLLCGNCQAAINHYQTALQDLRPFKDHLWMGGALEGVVAAALLLRGMDTAISLALPARTHAETTQLDGIGTRLGSESKLNADVENHRRSSSYDGGKSHSSFSSAGSKKFDRPRDSISSSGGSDSGDAPDGSSSIADEDLSVSTDYAKLMSDNSIEKNFKLAIDSYSKVGVAGRRAHIEGLIMFAGYLAKRNKHRKACELLEEAQILAGAEDGPFAPKLMLSFHIVLSEVYTVMKMERKVIFRLHSASKQAANIATELESQRKPSHNMYIQAYQLLWRCLSRYHLHSELDKPVQPVHSQQGWPQIQATFILEFVSLCKTLNYNELVIRWGWMLLQGFNYLLTENELKQVTACITAVTSSLKSSNSTSSLTSSTSVEKQQETSEILVSAPSPATNLPYIAVFKPQALAPQLVVKQSRNLFSSAVTSDTVGPFIYSALFKRKDQEGAEILWVQGDPAEVVLMISNPLSFEIKIEKMTMTIQGGEVTTYPSNITLPPCCEPQQFVLLCIPKKPGNLSLTGYKATLFGLQIESTVKSTADLVIQVLPTLPQLRAKVFSIRVSNKRGSGRGSPVLTKRSSTTVLDSWELLDGEEVECQFQMQSIGDVPVDNVKIAQTETSDYCEFSWNNEDILKLLPLSSKNHIYSFTLKVTAKIPSYLRVGSCEIVPSKSSSSSSSPSLNFGPGIVTIYESPKDSSPVDKRASLPLSQNLARLKQPVSYKKKASSLHRSMHDPSHLNMLGSTPLMESLDLPEPPVIDNHKGHSPHSKKLLSPRSQSAIEKPRSFSPQLTQRQWLPRRNKGTVAATSTPPASPQMFSKNGSGRLMDSLNLDQPSNLPTRSGNMSIRSNESANNSDTMGSPDTTSEMDFDDTFDATSLKSDPGDVAPPAPSSIPSSSSTHFLSPTHSSSVPSSTKSATMSSTRDNVSQMERRFLNFAEPLTDRLFSSDRRSSKRTAPSHAGHRGAKRLDSNKAPLTISSPKGPLHKVHQAPGMKNAKGVFLLQYTGGEGAKEGYYRQVTVDVSLAIKPTLVFYDFSVATMKGFPDLFHLNMVFENVSQQKLIVICEIDQAGLQDSQQQWTVNAGKKNSAQLVMKRFNVTEETAPQSDHSNEVKQYCQKLVEMIQFKWECEKLSKCGTLRLKGMLLPQSALNIIRPLPILFNPVMKADKFTVGAPIVFELGLTNNSGEVLPPSLITLCPYHYISSTMRVNCFEGDQVIISNSLHQPLPELRPDQTHKLAITLVFLFKGNYVMEINHHLPRNSPPPLPPPPPPHNGGVKSASSSLQKQAITSSIDLQQINFSLKLDVPPSPKPLLSTLFPISRTNSPSLLRANTPVTMATPIPTQAHSTHFRELLTSSNSYTGCKLGLHIS